MSNIGFASDVQERFLCSYLIRAVHVDVNALTCRVQWLQVQDNCLFVSLDPRASLSNYEGDVPYISCERLRRQIKKNTN